MEVGLEMKRLSILAFLLGTGAIASAGMTLTVNGVDASMPIEVTPGDDIIIAVAGQTNEPTESYSVTCEMGGELTPLPEPNTLAAEPEQVDYLFTFVDAESGLAVVDLTVGEVLDYQLALFIIPDANIVIFGIDSDAIEIPEPEPEPEPESEVEQIDLQFVYDYNNIVPYAQKKEQQKVESLKFCPGSSDSNETFSRAAYERWLEEHSEKRQGDGLELLMDGDPNIIEIYSDITTNQIWTADNIYYVTAYVNVQALLVIEPGTVIYFAWDYGSLFVNNGGTLISVGEPDNPITYTSDIEYGWGDYYCAIFVEETASPSTRIVYN